MRIAYYAPMKSPVHPVPSGDRRMARLLMRALALGGHDVEVVSSFRSWEGGGDRSRQHRLKEVGLGLARRLIRRFESRSPSARPQAWFTYHLYHKAPDWLGPEVSRALGIPYLVAEASFAPKQAAGPWSLGHRQAGKAISSADAVIALKRVDIPCVLKLAGDRGRVFHLKPFLNPRTYALSGRRRARRAALAEHVGLDPTVPWLLTVGMMRPGDKLRSYRVLGDALRRLPDRDWALVAVGDGTARSQVEAALHSLGPERIAFLGQQPAESMPDLYGSCDILVWPAINEAYGMALLEAQAAGLPVVAGRSGGVSDIVDHGHTGFLVPAGDPAAFAQAVISLADDPSRMRSMGRAARSHVARDHDLRRAASCLGRVLDEACRRGSPS